MAKKQKIIPGRNPLLELCPFCGEAAEIYCPDSQETCRVRCSNPDCALRPESRKNYSSEERAIKVWNSRKGAPVSSSDSLKSLFEIFAENRHETEK